MEVTAHISKGSKQISVLSLPVGQHRAPLFSVMLNCSPTIRNHPIAFLSETGGCHQTPTNPVGNTFIAAGTTNAERRSLPVVSIFAHYSFTGFLDDKRERGLTPTDF